MENSDHATGFTWLCSRLVSRKALAARQCQCFSFKSQAASALPLSIFLPSQTLTISVYGWPGLEGDRPKPRGLLRCAQSRPGHPLLIVQSTNATRATSSRLVFPSSARRMPSASSVVPPLARCFLRMDSTLVSLEIISRSSFVMFRIS